MFRHEIKLGVFGGVVGKTSLINRNIENVFVATNPTISDTYKHIIDVDGEQVKLDILDTNEYSASHGQWTQEGYGFILVYSITNNGSFEVMKEYHKRLYKVKDFDVSQFLPIIVVGNKIDLENERQISFEEGQQLADEWNVDFIECSAKEDINVNELFDTIALNVMENLPSFKRNIPTPKPRSCSLC
ncbi:Sphingomyelin phosphodiesterase [Entamoeba marina]